MLVEFVKVSQRMTDMGNLFHEVSQDVPVLPIPKHIATGLIDTHIKKELAEFHTIQELELGNQCTVAPCSMKRLIQVPYY